MAPGTPSAPQDSGQLYGHGGLSENGECLASLSGDLIVHGISGGGPIIFRYQTRMETYMDIFLDTFGSKEKGIPAVSYDFQILPGTHK